MIRDLIKDLLKYLPAQIVPAIMGLTTIPIITRLFPPADYGNYILVTATVSIFVTIVGWLNMLMVLSVYDRDGHCQSFTERLWGLSLSVTILRPFLRFTVAKTRLKIIYYLCSSAHCFLYYSCFRYYNNFSIRRAVVQYFPFGKCGG